MPKTERSTATFIVKEDGNGGTSLEVHLYEGLPSLKRGHLYLQMNAATTVQQAQEIADFLKDSVAHVAFLP